MKKFSIAIIICAAVLVIFTTSSCKGKASEKGTAVTVAILDTLNLDYANDGKRISFDGYLSFGHLPAAITKTYINVESDNTIKIEIYEDTNYSAKMLANVNVNYGTGANAVFFPEKDFTDDQVVVTTNDKQKLNLFEKISISGTVNLDKKSKTSTMRMFKAEGSLMPMVRTVTQYNMKLTDIRIDKIK